MPRTYDSYADLRDAGLKGGQGAKDWFKGLRTQQARQDAELEVIKKTRRKHPGLTNMEIIARYSSFLNKNFPQLSFPLVVF